MILIFGGHGQLGQELGIRAEAISVPVVALGRVDADIAEPAAVAMAVDRHRPTLIVNAAAYNQVDKAESEPDVAERINALGPTVLAIVAKAKGVPLVHVSTDYVFDGRKASAYRESDAVAPLNEYGRSKEKGERGVRANVNEHLILRTAWLFGSRGSNFMKLVMRLAAERATLDFVADQFGSPTSSTDLANAILAAERAIRNGRSAWGTYHVAGTGETSRHGLASAIVAAQARFTGRNPKVNPVPSSAFAAAAKRPTQSALDSSKFAETFGFRARDWKTAVERTVGEYFAGKVPA